MDRPTISIIVPTMAGREEMLKEALASIEAQTVKPFEVIVIKEPKDISLKINKAIGQAKGEAYTILADDDLLLPNYIEVAQSIMASKKCDIVSPFWQNFGENEEVCGPEPFPGPGSLFTKKIWEKVGGYDARAGMGTDADFGFMCREANARWVIIPDILTKFRLHSSNTSRNIDWAPYWEFIKKKYNGKYL